MTVKTNKQSALVQPGDILSICHIVKGPRPYGLKRGRTIVATATTKTRLVRWANRRCADVL